MADFSLDDVEALLNVAREATAWGSAEESVERRLTAVTDHLAPLVPFFSLTMLVVGPAGPELLLCRGAARPEDLETYAGRYMAHDPMVLGGGFGTSRVVTLSDVVRPHEHGRDPMTGEFLPRHGIRHVLAASPRLPDGSLLALGIHRDATHGDFSARERQLIGLASTDLARAAHAALLQARIGRLARTPIVTADAAEGAVLFDAEGEVLHADEVGRALLRLLGEEAATPIDQVVADVRRVAAAPAGAALEAPLRLQGGGRLRVRLDQVHGPGGAQVVGQLRLERPGPASRLEAFAERHRISAREREVAGLAIEGLGNRHIAFKLGISEPTVATHLSKVYRKAGVTNRTELARAVNGA